jgi:hypothetical protein
MENRLMREALKKNPQEAGNEIRTYGSYNLPLERLTPSAPQRGAVSPFAAFWEKLSWMSRTISML